jgi:YhcH/YjgK/YiaL family protein
MTKSYLSGAVQKALLTISLFILSCSVTALYSQENTDTKKWFAGREWLNGLHLTPHKTIDQEEFKKQYEANKLLWNKAFRFLKETDLAALKPGKYPIDGDNVFALVTEGHARSADTALWEDHQQYIDLHHVISGKENMGIAPVSSATVIKPYDSAKDIGFYKVKGKFYESDADTFFIVFPEDAHMPGIKTDNYNGPIKKIVIKIRKG